MACKYAGCHCFWALSTAKRPIELTDLGLKVSRPLIAQGRRRQAALSLKVQGEIFAACIAGVGKSFYKGIMNQLEYVAKFHTRKGCGGLTQTRSGLCGAGQPWIIWAASSDQPQLRGSTRSRYECFRMRTHAKHRLQSCRRHHAVRPQQCADCIMWSLFIWCFRRGMGPDVSAPQYTSSCARNACTFSDHQDDPPQSQIPLLVI